MVQLYFLMRITRYIEVRYCLHMKGLAKISMECLSVLLPSVSIGLVAIAAIACVEEKTFAVVHQLEANGMFPSLVDKRHQMF